MSIEGSEQKRIAVKLSFENHTRCECVGRNSDLMPRTEEVIQGPRGHHLMFVSIYYRFLDMKSKLDDTFNSNERNVLQCIEILK